MISEKAKFISVTESLSVQKNAQYRKQNQLRTLKTGLVAKKSVNGDAAKSVENAILDSVVGVSFSNH